MADSVIYGTVIHGDSQTVKRYREKTVEASRGCRYRNGGAPTDMTTDQIRERLAANMRRIRLRYGTQEVFEERTGIGQTYVSDLENQKGWKSLFNTLKRLEKAGTDPSELLQLEAPAHAAELLPEEDELLALWRSVKDPTIRGAALVLLNASISARAPVR